MKNILSRFGKTGNLTSMFSYVMSMLMALMILSMIFVMVTIKPCIVDRDSNFT